MHVDRAKLCYALSRALELRADAAFLRGDHALESVLRELSISAHHAELVDFDRLDLECTECPDWIDYRCAEDAG